MGSGNLLIKILSVAAAINLLFAVELEAQPTARELATLEWEAAKAEESLDQWKEISETSVRMIETLNPEDKAQVDDISEALAAFYSMDQSEVLKLNLDALELDLVKALATYARDKFGPVDGDKSKREKTWQAFNGRFEREIIKPCESLAVKFRELRANPLYVSFEPLLHEEGSSRKLSKETAGAIWQMHACQAIIDRKATLARVVFSEEFETESTNLYLKKYGFDKDILDSFMKLN